MKQVEKIENLKNYDECVLIPGYLRQTYPTLGLGELMDIARKRIPGNEMETKRYAEKMIAEVTARHPDIDTYVTPIGDIRIVLGKKSFMKSVKKALNELIAELDEVEDVSDIEDIQPVTVMSMNQEKIASERATIYSSARKLGIKIKAKSRGAYWLISYAGKSKSKRQRFLDFLDDIPYGVACDAPKDLDAAVLRVYMNNSQYYCSYRRGAVTKFRGVLRDGQLYIDGKHVSACKSRRMLEMLLTPYKLKPKHILNPRAPRIGSDSSCETFGDTGDTDD